MSWSFLLVRICDLYNKEGLVFVFGIRNLFCGRAGVCRILSTSPGAMIIRRPKLSSWLRDSSEYWIGPKARDGSHDRESARSLYSGVTRNVRRPARRLSEVYAQQKLCLVELRQRAEIRRS